MKIAQLSHSVRQRGREVGMLLVVLIGCLVLGFVGFKAVAAVAAILAIANVLLMRRDLFVVGCLLFISVVLDWYQLVGLPLALPVGAVLVAGAFVGMLFLTQSPAHPWATPSRIWLWGGVLLLGAAQLLHGLSVSESLTYFVNVVLGGFLFCVLGTLVARDEEHIKQLWMVLTVFGVGIALHSIIEARFGVFLFATSRLNDYLTTVNDFALAGTSTQRAASFLGNPDWNGVFLGMMLFVPLSLFFASTTRRAQIWYGLATIIIAVGLLFTYSTASFIAVGVGALVFAGLLTRGRFGGLPAIKRWHVAIGLAVLGILGMVFRHAIGLLAQHATATGDLTLRFGAWLTAFRVIAAHPLTGIGLGLNNYLQRAEPYRVALQYRPLAHPHNAYLELAAFGGLPLLVFFLAILVTLMALAVQAIQLAEGAIRTLLCGGFAAVLALSINSLAINGWTLAPLAMLGWLLLGALASPLLRKHLKSLQGAQRMEIRQMLSQDQR